MRAIAESWNRHNRENNKRFGEQKIVLSPAMMTASNKSLFDGSEHEYYLLVETDKMKTISATTQVSNEIMLSPGVQPPPRREPVSEQTAAPIAQEPVKVQNFPGSDPIVVGGISNAVADMPEELPKVEGIITAYFAKEEFTKETADAAGEYKYTFANSNDKIDKDKIAGIIKKKVDAQVKADKKYAKLDDIKTALTEASYAKGAIISFNLYKLGANFIKINSAPLEEEIYVVAKTFLLDGKEVTIKIKEKDVVLIGANADLPVLEAKEKGAEITALKAIVENGIAKVKIKLRPKADNALATWKEKLTGIKDGTHTYKFGSNNTTATPEEKKKIAGIIAEKIKTKLTELKKFAKVAIIEAVLTKEEYKKDEQITFDVYKKVIENLWLKAECQGTKKYEGDYLKKDGEYFVVGKKCECEERVRAFMRMLRVGEGTVGEKGYTRQFGGKQFSDLSNHPHDIVTSGGYSSSAAGAYQIMANTYDGLKTSRTKYNILNFNQESQDKLCLVILKHSYLKDRPSTFYNPTYWKDEAKTLRNFEKENVAKERRKRFKGQNGDIIKMLIDNNYDKAILLSALCWASLPDAPYGQPAETKEECKVNYDKFFNEEIEGKSDLHLKKGFLKEFGYDCCGKATSSGKWHDPVDNPIATIFTQSQSSGEFNHSGKHWGLFGDTRSGSAHAGLDLFAKTGTSIYSCVDGTVYNRRWHGSYGNTITIKVKDNEAFLKLKKDYDLQYEDDGEIDEGVNWSDEGDIFLFYAHLDSVKEYNFNDEVKSGDILGTTGRSGVNKGTCAPHLHFEILCDYTMAVGHKYRLNPGYYVDFKSYDEQTEQEKLDQQTEAKRGLISEVDGQNKLVYDNMENFKK